MWRKTGIFHTGGIYKIFNGLLEKFVKRSEVEEMKGVKERIIEEQEQA